VPLRRAALASVGGVVISWLLGGRPGASLHYRAGEELQFVQLRPGDPFAATGLGIEPAGCAALVVSPPHKVLAGPRSPAQLFGPSISEMLLTYLLYAGDERASSWTAAVRLKLHLLPFHRTSDLQEAYRLFCNANVGAPCGSLSDLRYFRVNLLVDEGLLQRVAPALGAGAAGLIAATSSQLLSHHASTARRLYASVRTEPFDKGVVEATLLCMLPSASLNEPVVARLGRRLSDAALAAALARKAPLYAQRVLGYMAGASRPMMRSRSPLSASARPPTASLCSRAGRALHLLLLRRRVDLGTAFTAVCAHALLAAREGESSCVTPELVLEALRHLGGKSRSEAEAVRLRVSVAPAAAAQQLIAAASNVDVEARVAVRPLQQLASATATAPAHASPAPLPAPRYAAPCLWSEEAGRRYAAVERALQPPPCSPACAPSSTGARSLRWRQRRPTPALHGASTPLASCSTLAALRSASPPARSWRRYSARALAAWTRCTPPASPPSRRAC